MRLGKRKHGSDGEEVEEEPVGEGEDMDVNAGKQSLMSPALSTLCPLCPHVFSHMLAVTT